MSRFWSFPAAFLIFLVFSPTASFAVKWVLIESDGQLSCARGYRPGGRLRGPSTLGVFASREACNASKFGEPAPKPKPAVVVIKKRKPVAVVVKKRKPVVVTVKKPKPIVVVAKKKKKKKKYVAPPPPPDDTAVH